MSDEQAAYGLKKLNAETTKLRKQTKYPPMPRPAPERVGGGAGIV